MKGIEQVQKEYVEKHGYSSWGEALILSPEHAVNWVTREYTIDVLFSLKGLLNSNWSIQMADINSDTDEYIEIVQNDIKN